MNLFKGISIRLLKDNDYKGYSISLFDLIILKLFRLNILIDLDNDKFIIEKNCVSINYPRINRLRSYFVIWLNHGKNLKKTLEQIKAIKLKINK
jgi:hypothetical protein